MANIRKMLFRGPVAAVRIIWALASGMPLRFLEILGQIFPENSWGCKLRGAFYKPFLKKCGRNFQVALHAKLECLQRIRVEDDVYIGHGCWINGSGGGIHFESEAMLGPYVTMVAGEHGLENGSARFSRSGNSGHIHIGFGSWVASHAVITSGVTIGRGCLIAAGAVVTKDVEDGCVVGGVPARPILF
jgi:acetyltransferase-like isoleucine patch superfamily enzyme